MSITSCENLFKLHAKECFHAKSEKKSKEKKNTCQEMSIIVQKSLNMKKKHFFFTTMKKIRNIQKYKKRYAQKYYLCGYFFFSAIESDNVHFEVLKKKKRL